MNKLKVLLVSAFLVNSLAMTTASAQIVGGILCGIGVYCPPQLPPTPKPAPQFILIEGSSVGATLPDFYKFNDFAYLGSVLKDRMKDITPFYSFTWEKKVNYTFIVQSTFEVLKVGRRFDGYVPCFQYKHVINVKEISDQNRKGNTIATENLIGNACGVTPDLMVINGNSRYGHMYYETHAGNIVFKSK